MEWSRAQDLRRLVRRVLARNVGRGLGMVFTSNGTFLGGYWALVELALKRLVWLF